MKFACTDTQSDVINTELDFEITWWRLEYENENVAERG